ncbi:coatomer complex protein [Amanita rubescens]|nr:coatomer complex protein [Amanita rubescens]
MESTQLYHVKQQFILGAYKSLADMPLPDISSSDYTSVLLYKARAHIALNDPQSALRLTSEDNENVAVKAVRALAKYVAADDDVDKDAALEEQRDLAVEIEGDDSEGGAGEKALVRVIAATAFVRAGETEEALETLGTDTEDLEAVALLVQIYLSINRPDLAKKQFDRSKKWAEDDLLLQLIESTIGLVTGKDGYSNSSSFYTEQLANPSLTSPHILTARGVTRILRNEVQEAKSDLEESLEQQKGDAETLAALCVAASLGASKKQEAEDLWVRLTTEQPNHPLVVDVSNKTDLFDRAAAKYDVPPIATAA